MDADDPGPDGGLLWQVRLTDHGAFPAPLNILTIQSNVGILSTPVIDRARSAIYVVAGSLGSTGYVQRLHVLDLLTGREKPGSPVEIRADARLRADGRPVEIRASVQRDGLTFAFNPAIQRNRPGLALSGSSVVIAWSPLDADNTDHGWVMAYDADTLYRTGVSCTSCARAVNLPCPDPKECEGQPRRPWLIGGGIWQSGRPPAVDGSDHVYYFVGNGWTLATLARRHGTTQPASLGRRSQPDTMGNPS